MSDFQPRLSSAGMSNNKYWYSQNPFHQAGYGLPNCTCYAWGRFWEEAGDQYRPNLSLSDAKNWYGYNDGYTRSRQPQLGAVACWSNPRSGHVAIVEEIGLNYITISESIYGGSYFRTNTIGLDGSYPNVGDYTFQGYIINPHVEGSITTGKPNIVIFKNALLRRKYDV